MIVATGVDLVELPRLEKILAEHGERFLNRILTPAEAAYCTTRAHLATSFGARFAAKEAVMKCLGRGLTDGVAFRQIEVTRTEAGAVGIRLSGRAAEIAQQLGIARFHLSLSHTGAHAVAMAVAEG